MKSRNVFNAKRWEAAGVALEICSKMGKSFNFSQNRSINIALLGDENDIIERLNVFVWWIGEQV